MASVEKQLLGLETARALRAKGVTASGADAFMIKSFPCEEKEPRRELLRLLKE
jgi:hypothetical protein